MAQKIVFLGTSDCEYGYQDAVEHLEGVTNFITNLCCAVANQATDEIRAVELGTTIHFLNGLTRHYRELAQ